MEVYRDLAVILNFLVDFLLLLGANRMAGYPPSPGRAMFAAGIGAGYAAWCLMPGFGFLGNALWRLVSLCIMGAAAYGLHRSAVRRTALFIFLSFALGGIASGVGDGGLGAVLLGAAGVCALCLIGFQGGSLRRQFVPVELSHAGKRMKLTALHDTGNTLRDPVTGQSVLVADGSVGMVMAGLTREQLDKPVETVASAAVPGLRLIPYKAVGQGAGMLLALRFEHVKIGSWQGSSLVAFAPQGIGCTGEYQALTGGML